MLYAFFWVITRRFGNSVCSIIIGLPMKMESIQHFWSLACVLHASPINPILHTLKVEWLTISVFDLPLPVDLLKCEQGSAECCFYTDSSLSSSQWLSIVSNVMMSFVTWQSCVDMVSEKCWKQKAPYLVSCCSLNFFRTRLSHRSVHIIILVYPSWILWVRLAVKTK